MHIFTSSTLFFFLYIFDREALLSNIDSKSVKIMKINILYGFVEGFCVFLALFLLS